MFNLHTLAFVISNLLAVLVALGLACSLLSGRPRSQIAIGTLVGYPLVIIAALLPLGAMGHLSMFGVFVVMAPAAIVILIWLAARTRRQTPGNLPLTVVENPLQERLAQELAVPVCLLAAFAGVVVFKACWSGTQFFADDLGYHGPTVARWIQDGRFSYVTRNFTAYYPFNCELLSLWYVLPLHSDAWVALAGLVWLAMSACAAGALGRELRLTAVPAALVMVLTICSPSIDWLVRTFSPTDLAAASLALAGLYFTGLVLRRSSADSAIAESLYAGLLVGAAVGCKITVIPVFVVAVLALLFGRTRFQSVLAFCLAAVLTGSFWYIRNWIITGNPLFPAAIGPFAGPWTRDQQAVEKLANLVGKSPSLPKLGEVLKKAIDWPVSLAALSVIGYLAALLRELTAGRSSADENHSLRRLLLVSGLALLAAYPFVPFSANNYGWRYVTAPFLIGLVLYGRLIDERHPLHWFWRAVALVAIVTCWPGPGRTILVAFLSGALGLAVLYLVVHRSWRLSSASIVVASLAGTTALFLGLAALTNHQQRATDNALQQYGAPDRPIGKAWSALEAAPPGSSIAYFMNRDYEILPLFGRRYQFDPVAVDSSGNPLLPLFERFRADPTLTVFHAKMPLPGDPAELIHNLQTAGIKYVFVSKWRADDWPPQHAILAHSDHLRVLYQDDYSVVWRLTSKR
jgi:hypothetical protein